MQVRSTDCMCFTIDSRKKRCAKRVILLSFGEFLRCVVKKGNPNVEISNEGKNFLEQLFTDYGIMINS